MRTYAPVLTLCALALVPTLSARAADTPVTYKPCEKKPSENDTEAAKGLFQAGKVSYEEGDNLKAIQLWRDAFDRDCTATPLLRNLSNAYERAGNLDGAIVSLETLLKRDPQLTDGATIQKRIDNLKKARTPPPSSTPIATATAPATTAAPTSTPPPPPSTTPTSETGSRPLTPLFVAGGGAVVGIVGFVVYLAGKNKYDEAYSTAVGDAPGQVKTPGEGKFNPGGTPEQEDKTRKALKDGESANTQRLIGSIVGFTGLGIAAGGTVWYLLSKPEEKTSGRVIVPMPALAPGYAGFSLGGRF